MMISQTVQELSCTRKTQLQNKQTKQTNKWANTHPQTYTTEHTPPLLRYRCADRKGFTYAMIRPTQRCNFAPVICSYQNLFTACKLRPKTQSEARPYDKVIVVHTAAKFSVSSDVTWSMVVCCTDADRAVTDSKLASCYEKSDKVQVKC